MKVERNEKKENGSKERFVLPAGRHRAKVWRASEGPSKSSGRNQLTIVMKSPPTGDPVSWIRAYIGASQTQRLNAMLAAFGMPPDADEIDPESLSGLECDVVLGVEDDPDYGTKNFVSDWIPARTTVQATHASEAKAGPAFSTNRQGSDPVTRAASAPVSQAAAAARKPAGQRTSTKPAEDDIPF